MYVFLESFSLQIGFGKAISNLDFSSLLFTILSNILFTSVNWIKLIWSEYLSLVKRNLEDFILHGV